jgi:hypothetical protein
MLNALGPVIGNRLADAHRATLKPHLHQRLALLTRRSTPLGTVATGADGRLSFAPGYLASQESAPLPAAPEAEDCTFLLGARVRVTATLEELSSYDHEPFPALAAWAVQGREGGVVEHVLYGLLGLVGVELDGMAGLVWGFMPEHLARACPAEGDGEREAMESGPSFDPYGEPLALGDTVQGMDGRIGRVTLVQAQRLGVVFERGSAWCGDMNWRASFRLLAKAAPTTAAAAWGSTEGCPF